MGLPSISQLFPTGSVEEPVFRNANPASMFYAPLCVFVAPDPVQNFYDLVTGKVQPENCNYNEPLPLKIHRLESLRIWYNTERAQKQLLLLGAVILRKLFRTTQNLTVLVERDKSQTDVDTNAKRKKKRKTMYEFGKFVEFGHKMFKYRYTPFMF